MKLPFRLLALPTVISVLALQLTGCSEGGNNLVDPVAEQINTITTCDGEKDLCISGQFIDEPVVGLNYSCLLYTSPSPRDRTRSRMPSSA